MLQLGTGGDTGCSGSVERLHDAQVSVLLLSACQQCYNGHNGDTLEPGPGHFCGELRSRHYGARGDHWPHHGAGKV